MKALLVLLASLAVLSFQVEAKAFVFLVDIDVLRPALMVPDNDKQRGQPCSQNNAGVRQRDPHNGYCVQWVPAAFQYVEVYRDGIFPKLLGAGYTNSDGTLSQGFWSDSPPGQIEIVVYGYSARGFNTGQSQDPFNPGTAGDWQWHSGWIWTGNRWQGSQYAGVNAIFNFGAFPLGWGSGPQQWDIRYFMDFRVAAEHELVDFLYEQWNLGGIMNNEVDDPTAPLYFIYTNWNLHSSLSILKDNFGGSEPFTFWLTMHAPAGGDADYLFRSIPHELGHMLYNVHHGSYDHWLGDVPVYLSPHSPCLPRTSTYPHHFAHYEGIANTFRDLTWARYNSDMYSFGAVGGQGCGVQGAHVEGNVEAFYNFIFAGEDGKDSPQSSRAWGSTEGKGGFPPAWNLFDMVAVNQYRGHALRDMWPTYKTYICQPGVYCSSEAFKTLVRSRRLFYPGEFDPAL